MTETERSVLGKKIVSSSRKAVKKAIQEHFAHGRSIVVMEEGKLRKIYPPNGKKKSSSRH